MNTILRPGLNIHCIHRSCTTVSGIVESTIRNKLRSLLEAKHLEVFNESFRHHVSLKLSQGAETHFKVVVVSDKFNGLPIIKRHRLINEILKEELQNGVHGLSIVAKTPEQWEGNAKLVKNNTSSKSSPEK